MPATAEALQPRFLLDVIEGLSKAQKTLPSRWLYDEVGSDLFEQITKLPEYYLTRAEIEILKAESAVIAAAAGTCPVLVEYGSGGSIKTRLLIDAFSSLSKYVPIDVSWSSLTTAAEELRRDYPGIQISPVVGDFLDHFRLPELDPASRRVGFFPGSTIGNLSDREIRGFLKRAREELGDRAIFVLGYDLRKDPSILVPAYDDSAGVTAAFNLNVLTRLKRELSAEIDVGGFAHEARWNSRQSRVEMHLVSLCQQTVGVAGEVFALEQGETIHTENSRKFEIAAMEATCAETGWQTVDTHTDDHDLFAVALMRAR